MGALGMFFQGGEQIQGCEKGEDLFSVQNTLQHFQGASSLKTFHFLEGAPVFVKGGGRLCHGSGTVA